MSRMPWSPQPGPNTQRQKTSADEGSAAGCDRHSTAARSSGHPPHPSASSSPSVHPTSGDRSPAQSPAGASDTPSACTSPRPAVARTGTPCGFRERILPFDSASARAYAKIAAERRQAVRQLGEADCQIAAICRSRGAVLVTRNVRDFQSTGVEVVNPWGATQ